MFSKMQENYMRFKVSNVNKNDEFILNNFKPQNCFYIYLHCSFQLCKIKIVLYIISSSF